VLNERNIIVHGKNSIQTRAAVASSVARGSVLRMRQRMRLGIAPGTYTFNVGLASLPLGAHTQADAVPYDVLVQHIRPVVVINGAGHFTVVPPRSGHSLPYHGLCDLDGDVAITTEDPSDA
jgi:lipopolysaccharide transport system ATP-binding protein